MTTPWHPGEERTARPKPARRWRDKFAEAFRGVRLGVQGQSSFCVHLFFTAVAVLAGVLLGIDRVEWCLVAGCVGLVWTAELFNSSVETLFKGLDPEARDRVYPCLDIAAGAVLVASATAVVVGAIVFGGRVLAILGAG